MIYPDDATRYLNSQARAQNATAVRAIVSTPEAITGPSERAFYPSAKKVSHCEPSLARVAGERSPRNRRRTAFEGIADHDVDGPYSSKTIDRTFMLAGRTSATRVSGLSLRGLNLI